MADTKQTKTIGEHWVASELDRRDWAPAMTRDGLERNDSLAVKATDERPMIEVQVKSARGLDPHVNWPLGAKAQGAPKSDREWFVMVSIHPDNSRPMCGFVVPRAHVAAAAWITHMHWLTEPGRKLGKRNAPVSMSREYREQFAGYEGRWDLLDHSAYESPVLLPPVFRDYAMGERVGRAHCLRLHARRKLCNRRHSVNRGGVVGCHRIRGTRGWGRRSA